MYTVYDSVNEELIGPFASDEEAMQFITDIEEESGETGQLAIQSVTPAQQWYMDNVMDRHVARI